MKNMHCKLGQTFGVFPKKNTSLQDHVYHHGFNPALKWLLLADISGCPSTKIKNGHNWFTKPNNHDQNFRKFGKKPGIWQLSNIWNLIKAASS